MISYRDQYRNCRILGHSELRRLDVPRVYDRGDFQVKVCSVVWCKKYVCECSAVVCECERGLDISVN